VLLFFNFILCYNSQMTWALKRQIIYLLIFLALFGGFGFLIIYPHFNVAPTCFDNKQNGTELGVDCGGGCALVCSFQAKPINVLWARSFYVVDGRYNAVAYLENPNKNAGVFKIHYKFRFADKDNLYIGSREGDTFVPPGKRFAVFEPAISTGNSLPVFTSFEFTQTPTWVVVPDEKINEFTLTIGDTTVSNVNISPVISSSLKNDSLFSIPEVKTIIILYDEKGNVINASSTYVDSIAGGTTVPINFTWPQSFGVGVTIAKKEIIPLFNIFSTKFK